MIQKSCQVCTNPLSAADLDADPYTRLCLDCWSLWQIEAGAPLVRYLQKIGQQKCVCTACGMTFGGLTGFDRHRNAGRCRSPAELRAQNHPLAIKNGIWVSEPPRNAQISPRRGPGSDSTEKTMAMPHPQNHPASNRVAGGFSA